MSIDTLKSWDTIYIISPSSFYDNSSLLELSLSVNYLKKKWFNVVLWKSVLAKDKYSCSSWNLEVRISDINTALLDKNVKMIWFSPWGSTSNELLEHIDYNLIKNNPKIITWFSDITILLNAIYSKTSLPCFYWTDIKSSNNYYFGSDYTKRQFENVFCKWNLLIEKNSNWKVVREWGFRWILVWWHLQSFVRLIWTSYIPNLMGCVLLLESFAQWPDNVIPYLYQLKQSWVFDKISWIIVWYIYWFDFIERVDSSGNRIYFEDILLDITKSYNFPIIKINEFWHRCPSTFLPIWSNVEFDYNNQEILFDQNLFI